MKRHGQGIVRTLRSRKTAVVGGLVIAAIAAGTFFVVARSDGRGAQDGQTAQTEHPVDVTVAQASRVSLPLYYEATGVVRSELESDLAAKVMGRVVRLDVREGDTVRAGQPLIWLDSRDLQAAVAQAQAGEKAARVGVDAAVVTARMERSASEARIEAARALVRQSEAAVASARARLDLVKTGPRKQERAQAALAVAQAKAALELAEADYTRMAMLLKEGAVSKQQTDAARTQRDVAKARYDAAVEALSMTEEGNREEDIRAAEEGLRQAEAALEAARQGLRQAEAAALMSEVREQEVRGARVQVSQALAALRLARTTQNFAVLHAPYDGVVSRRMADVGDMANPGVPLLTVQGGSLRIEATVPERVLTAVRKGDVVPVELDALGRRVLQGPVVEISPQGDPASHTFTVRVELDRRSGALAGMFGRVRLMTGRQQRLTVPSDAVRSRDGLHYVWLVGPNNVLRMRLVTVGKEEDGRTPVLSGLRQGEIVVTGSPVGLRDGQKVRF